MSRKKKIVLSTNPPWLKTGLAENGRFLAQWLYKTGKYDLTYYASQSHVNDPNHSRQPWKSRGCIPNDPSTIQQLNQDPNRARMASYGGLLIDQVIKDEKPDILWCSDDVWSFGGEFFKANWWNKINPILHITIDSLPILDQAYEQAKVTPNFFTWAKFGSEEMSKRGSEWSHVGQIYGATNINNFAPITDAEKAGLRRRFGIGQNTLVFGYTFRNQLRKEATVILQAFHQFKKTHPNIDAKLHLHTSWSETANGWDFPKIIKYIGIDPKDVLCTYVCRNCGNWHVAPYIGEDQNCPYCGAQKSMITASINHGVADEEMKYVYGIRDATVSAFTSGGLEYENVNTLLCGLPLASTNYSCGQDFCKQPFVYPIKWHSRNEAGTSFIKATNDVESIRGFMETVASMSPAQKRQIGEQGRDWAKSTFSIETIGPQWEKVFDNLPPKDWSSISLDYVKKNDSYPMPQTHDDQAWVTELYNKILLCEPDPDGLKNWLAQIKAGVSRDAIYQFFVKVAKDDNAKAEPPKDFGTLFDQNGRKKILFVMKESGGDLFISTALFKGIKDLYPDSDLYVGCDPKFFDVLAGNPYVHKLLPYLPAMEQELIMMAYVDAYYFPAVQTQRQLGYLSRSKVGLNLTEGVK